MEFLAISKILKQYAHSSNVNNGIPLDNKIFYFTLTT